MKKSLALPVLIGTGLLLNGCGGGGGNSTSSGGSSPTGASQSTTIGNASFTYQGNLRATVSATGSSVTSFGVAGANISAMSYYPTNNIADTNILYQDNLDIYSYSLRTFTTTNLTHSNFVSSYPAAASNGTIAYAHLDSFGSSNIWTMKPDGSNQVQITKGSNSYESVSISPNGSLLDAIALGTLDRVTLSGSSTPISSTSGPISAQTTEGSSWSPDNTRIVFNGGANNLYTVPASGGTPTLIYSGKSLQYASWSADSSQLVVCDAEKLYIISSTGPSTQIAQPIIGTTSSNIAGAAFSPDGKRIAYLQDSAPKGIYTCDPDSGNPTYMAAAISPINTPVVWTGFLPPETMVGSGGLLNAPSASGVVVSTGSKGFGSLVSFSATTPSSAVVVGASSSQGPIGFTVSADSITSISWMNSYFGPPSQKTLTSTPQLLFAVDGSTGNVSFVAPAVTPKTEKISKVVKGSSVVYSGKFTSVFDGQGNNIAPSGATSITVDASTSKVLSAR